MTVSMKKISTLAAAALVAVSLSANHALAKGVTIVETAVNAGSFQTLVAALKAANLVDTLNGTGPFTIFAPTDAAFAKLPAGTVEDLLKPENKAKLTAILTYHVVPGKIMAADLAGKKTMAKTVQGSDIMVDAMAGVMINESMVTGADVGASNGVIHIIDTVLIPKS